MSSASMRGHMKSKPSAVLLRMATVASSRCSKMKYDGVTPAVYRSMERVPT